MCTGMARSTFYYSLAHSKAPDKHAGLRERISRIFEENHRRYGYRRVTLALAAEGCHVNHKTVRKLMVEMGLRSPVRKVRYKSYKGEVGKVAPNVLERDFKADAPTRKWATDVTEFKIRDTKAYLSPILDMFNGEIVSYVMSDSPSLKMVTDMFEKAVASVANTKGTILHSDQGWHYQHRTYQKMLKDNGIVQSMSRKGNCLDNSMMENFFGILKSELLYLNKYDSMDEFKDELAQYIDYYNNKRIKLRLNGMSPVQYRAQFYNNIK